MSDRSLRKIVVTGGTGVLGSVLVHQLTQQSGLQVMVVSRNRRRANTYRLVPELPAHYWKPVDLVSGEGLMEALAHADTVFHLASDQTMVEGMPADLLAMRNLLAVAQQAQVKHLIYSSIVGVDRIPLSYYETKLTAETMLQQSGLSYTILRATQFHEFIDFILSKLFTLPIGFVPKNWKAQPISIQAVAAELVSYVNREPQQTILQIGGCQILDFATLAAVWQRYQPYTKPVLGLPLIGNLMHSFTQGYNTCAEVAPSSQTWEMYLQTQSP